MRIEDIREVHARRPFQPFALRMADGRALEVRHPEMLAYSTSGRTVHYVHDDDRFERADVMLITSVEELPPQKRNGNGRKSKD